MFSCLGFFLFSPPLVPAGGENGSEAAAGVCGVLRVQRAAAHTGHHLRGHEERYNHVYVFLLMSIFVSLNADEIDESSYFIIRANFRLQVLVQCNGDLAGERRSGHRAAGLRYDPHQQGGYIRAPSESSITIGTGFAKK